jgi:hypothetical protein
VALALGAGLSAYAAAGETGPDVVAFYVANSINELGSIGGIGGYAIGTTSCNYGDQVANWYSGTNNTPLIGQNAYRLHNGRFEQIGLSWLKHSFCALSEPGCGDCQPTSCATLGIGCADTYGAGLNTNPSGPRSDADAFSGYYQYPFTVSPSGPSALRGNLQIADADLNPAVYGNARYFFEAYYMSDDDAAWGNHANNASYREFTTTGAGNVNAIGSTHVETQAIRAWKEIDPSVDMHDVHVPADGFFIVGAKATDIGNGMWHYEYAVWNHNSNACGGSFSVFMPPAATVTNIGFTNADYHSGEVYATDDWSVEQQGATLTWSTTPYAANPNANALRWATMYNFRFDCNVAPSNASEITIGTFKPGYAATVSVATIGPPMEDIDPCDLPLGDCPADLNGDYVVDVNDILIVLADFGTCGDGTFRPAGDIDGDCCTNVNDLLHLISAFGADCAPTGACCTIDGACAMTSEADCKGTWHGEGFSCAWVNCPQPGACCLSDTECIVVQHDVCTASEGSFRGEGTTCGEVDCAAAEFNDYCYDAWVVGTGSHDFSTASATNSGFGEPDENQCSGTYLDWDGSPDVWFKTTVATSGSMTVSLCDSGSYDTSLVLYEGTYCEDLTQVACNGDSSVESGCQAYYSGIYDFPVTAGSTYFIRIGGWLADTGQGTMTLEVD